MVCHLERLKWHRPLSSFWEIVLKWSTVPLSFFLSADSPGVESASFFNLHLAVLGQIDLALGVDSGFLFGPEGNKTFVDHVTRSIALVHSLPSRVDF